MKKTPTKKPRVLKPEPLVKKSPSKPKKSGLSKKDPNYYAKIGSISAKKRRMSSADFSAMAKKSHPRADGHKGGRPRNNPESAE